jgi:hypothetical protein
MRTRVIEPESVAQGRVTGSSECRKGRDRFMPADANLQRGTGPVRLPPDVPRVSMHRAFLGPRDPARTPTAKDFPEEGRPIEIGQSSWFSATDRPEQSGDKIDVLSLYERDQIAIAVTYSGVAIAGAAATVVTLIDLIFQFDSRARLHDDLYRRFKSLQADIARHRAEAERYISEWDAKSQEIRVDEPPVYWSIYAACWNQAAERRRAPKEYIRSISLWRVLAGKYLLFHFRPNDFPVGA